MSGRPAEATAPETRIPPRYATGMRAFPSVLGLLALVSAAVILFLFNPAQSGFYPACLFYKSTGLLCPGCGALRAMHQLLHGHIAAALHFNALVVLSLPLGVWSGWRLLLAAHQSRPVDFRIRPAWLWCALAVLVLFGVLRNLPFAQAVWLAP